MWYEDYQIYPTSPAHLFAGILPEDTIFLRFENREEFMEAIPESCKILDEESGQLIVCVPDHCALLEIGAIQTKAPVFDEEDLIEAGEYDNGYHVNLFMPK